MQESSEGQNMTFKCRKCRHFLFSNNEICDAHGKPLIHNKTEHHTCNTPSNVWYLREDVMPSWLKIQIDEYDWTKGKIHCDTCKCRIGSFDFISGSKCNCGSSVLPALHVVSSKVDCQVALSPSASRT